MLVAWWPRLVLAVGALTAALTAPTAGADGEVRLGGGGGIVIDGSYCTLATIGHDNADALVGFTAAHCGGPGAPVVAEGAEARGPVGTVVTADDDLDYAVIAFDPAKVFPVAHFDGFAIDGIGPDPSFGQPVCTHGGATGFGCGSIEFPGLKPATVSVRLQQYQQYQAGDDGAPVTVDGQLVGMTSHGHSKVLLPVPVGITHITLTLFSAILNDLNTKGGPGAGFVPTPA